MEGKCKMKLEKKKKDHAKPCLTLDIPQSVAHQAPLSMRFSRQKYWSSMPFPSTGDLPGPGVEPRSPTLHADALLTELTRALYIAKKQGISQ